MIDWCRLYTQAYSRSHLNSDGTLLVRCGTQLCCVTALSYPGQIVDKRLKHVVQRQITVIVDVYVHHSLSVWRQGTRGTDWSGPIQKGTEKGWVLWFQRVKDRFVWQDKPVFHTLESENPTFLMTAPVEKPALKKELSSMVYVLPNYTSIIQITFFSKSVNKCTTIQLNWTLKLIWIKLTWTIWIWIQVVLLYCIIQHCGMTQHAVSVCVSVPEQIRLSVCRTSHLCW